MEDNEKVEPFEGRKRVTISSNDENMDPIEETGEWKSRRHFLLAAIASSVGLGNIWRFPSLLKIHGGGAFLLAYCILTIICGIPMLYIEFSVGEIMNMNLLNVWGQVHPIASGIGYSSCLLSLLISSYYAVIVSWVLHYFLYSFQSPLPWLFCPFKKSTSQDRQLINTSMTVAQRECHRTTPEAYYWYRESLNISSGIDTTFQWNIYLTVVVAFVWFFVFLNLREGIQNASKIITCNVIFPYVALAILLLRTVFITGSSTGLIYLIKPKWSSLGNIKLWTDAASQALFSLSLGTGSMVVYGSMNHRKKKRNCLKDAVIVTFTDSFTSILGALVVYSILGIRAEEQQRECVTNHFHSIPTNCSITNFLEKAEGGTGLVFIDFTYTIAFIPGATLFSAVFFLTLFSLGFTSLVSFIVASNEIVRNMFEKQRKRQMFFLGVACVCLTFSSLLYTQPSGEYIVQLFASDSQDIPFLVIMLMEVVSVGRSKNIRKELKENFNYPCFAKFMEIISYIVNPALIIGIIVSVVFRQVRSSGVYKVWEKDKGSLTDAKYPVWATAIGFTFAFIPLLPIFVGAIAGLRSMYIERHKKSGKLRLSWKNTQLFQLYS